MRKTLSPDDAIGADVCGFPVRGGASRQRRPPERWFRCPDQPPGRGYGDNRPLERTCERCGARSDRLPGNGCAPHARCVPPVPAYHPCSHPSGRRDRARGTTSRHCTFNKDASCRNDHRVHASRKDTTGIPRSPALRHNPLKEALPAILLVVSAAAWGIFWIPLRALESAGFPAGATVAGQFVMPALVLLPFAVILATRGRATGLAQWHTGLFTGGAFALYADSLLLTEIARALILFYVSPAWSTVFEIWLLKKRLTLARIVAMVLGFAGLYVILGGDGSLPLPRNAGGLGWPSPEVSSGPGARQGSRSPPGRGALRERPVPFFLYGAVVASGLMLFPLAGLGPLPSAAAIIGFLPWFLLIAAGFLLPVVFPAALCVQVAGSREGRYPVAGRSRLRGRQRSHPDQRTVRLAGSDRISCSFSARR